MITENTEAGYTLQTDFARGGPQVEAARRDRRAFLTTCVALAFRVIDGGAKLAIIPTAVRMLGLPRYGIWLTANSILTLLMVSDFGIGSGLINAVSAAEARGDRTSVRAFIATAYVGFSSFALCLVIVVDLLTKSPLLAHWLGISRDPTLELESRRLFLLMGCLVASSAFLNVINFVVAALQEGYLAQIAQIAASVTALIWIISLRSLDMSAFAMASALPVSGAYLLLTLYIFGFHHREIAPSVKGMNIARFRLLWRDSSRLLIAQIADTVIICASNVLVATRLGSAHVAEVSVSLSVMMIFSFVCSMFLLPLWPAYVEARVRGDWAWIRSAFARGAAKSLASIVLCTLIYAAAYRLFLHTWSKALPIPPLSFVGTLSIWFLIYVWNKNSMVLLNALGYTHVRAWVAPLSATTFVLVALATLPSFGILGIPIAGIASALCEAAITTSKALAVLVRESGFTSEEVVC
jgi:O-antigen/teichoic acid export membrane protein